MFQLVILSTLLQKEEVLVTFPHNLILMSQEELQILSLKYIKDLILPLCASNLFNKVNVYKD